MPPARPAAIRPTLLACALAAALALSACGGDEGTTAGNAPSAPDGAQKARSGDVGATRAAACPVQVGGLVSDLSRLRRQLAIGLSYDQYAARVKQLNTAYAAIPVERLTIACLRSAGSPAERALNRYIDGANAWGECLADASCTTATIEPVLQRKWRVASHFLSEAS